VGQRRSLMKRALVGIVPNELLNRRRRAFVPPEPKKDSSTEWPSLVEIGQYIIGSSEGIIDPERFAEALQKARHNGDVPIGSLKRTLTLASWLRHLATYGILANSMSAKKRDYSTAVQAEELQAPTHPNSLASYVCELQKERR